MTAGAARILLLLVVAAGCRYDRPVNPWQLEGFPAGASIRDDLFPLRDGDRWVFRDRVNDGRELVLSIERDGDGFLLRGRKGGPLGIGYRKGFLEIRSEGRLVERPLKTSGLVADEWTGPGARYVALGYDRVQVLGATVRALVVVAERSLGEARVRDLYWFAPDLGWVRIRTERDGRAVRDAVLVGRGAAPD